MSKELLESISKENKKSRKFLKNYTIYYHDSKKLNLEIYKRIRLERDLDKSYWITKF